MSVTKYWLVKSEPGAYSWDDLVKDGQTYWDGVRNYQARNNLRAMAPGDRVLFYHSGSDRQVMGLAEVVSRPYPDPTTDDERWVVVDIVPRRPLDRPVSLAAIKADPKLAEVALVRQPRLSVMPLTKAEFERLIKLGRPADTGNASTNKSDHKG